MILLTRVFRTSLPHICLDTFMFGELYNFRHITTNGGMSSRQNFLLPEVNESKKKIEKKKKKTHFFKKRLFF